MITSIHQSMLNSFLACGVAFEKRYIEGLKTPPNIAMGRGTGVHRAAEVNERHKMDTGGPLAPSDVADITHDAYKEAFSDGVYLVKKDQGSSVRLLNDGLNDALRCAEVYLTSVSPKLKPVDVEKPFKIEVPGIKLPLEGIIDIDEVWELGDLKTSNKIWPKNREKEEIQPTFYSYVHEAVTGIRPKWTYHILIARRGKYGPTTQEYTPIHLDITDQAYRALKAKLQVFEDALRKGVFLPALPTDWKCGPKFCGYWNICKYVGN